MKKMILSKIILKLIKIRFNIFKNKKKLKIKYFIIFF
jgi:hypothetical protein